MQPPKSLTLHAIVVQLGLADRIDPPATLGRAIHAQVTKWLSIGDPQLTETIHASQDSPIALSGLLGKRRETGSRAGDDFSFRIVLLDGDLIHPLLKGIEEWGTQPITLGKCPFVIRSVCSMPGTHPFVGSSSYELLMKTPKITDLTLQFSSPTSFKQNQTVQPFPLPELVFGSLLRRWNAFAPMQFPPIAWQGMISAFDLKTHALRLEGGAEIGAQGWVRYRFPDPEQAAIASILAHFAFFAGVGRKTTMGMGQTRLDSQISKPKFNR